MRMHPYELSLCRMSFRLLLVCALLLPLFSWLGVEAGQAGGVIQVNSPLDQISNDGLCTLREAIIAANKDQKSGSKPGECAAGRGADTIQIPGGLGDILLTRKDQGKEDASATGDLDILKDVLITATGPGVVVAGSSDFTDRIFHVLGGKVTLRGFSIRGGNSSEGGGAILNQAVLRLEQVTVSGNHTRGSGGGLHNTGSGLLTLVNSTISGNSSQGDGGGLFNLGKASLNNVTIFGNTTHKGNGGGVAAAKGTVQTRNSILAGNQDAYGGQAPDCSGSLMSEGYNLVGSLAGCKLGGDSTGNLTGLDPLLEPLADQGGNTPTHALAPGSPAIDAGNPAQPSSGGKACEAVDQRGIARPQGAACDIGAYEAEVAESVDSAVILRAVSAASGPNGLQVVGRLNSTPDRTFNLQFYASPVCDPAGGNVTPLGGAVPITTDPSGNVFFNIPLQASAPRGHYLWAVTSSQQGGLSEPSRCVRVGSGNDSWPNALRIDATLNATVDDVLDLPGQSRWYKFRVEPNSQLRVTLTGLPANYDLTLFKDISQAFTTLNSPADLLLLGAEFAPEAFSPEAFSPEAFSPEAFSPEAFSPEAFSPEAFSPEAFSPEAFSPEAFSPEAFSPEAFSPDAYSPEAFSPEAFSPEAFSPEAFSPEAFSPEAFSSAQTRSLIGISAFNGLAGEGLSVNTWNNSGDYYVRVHGRGGAFDPFNPFRLNVQLMTEGCSGVSDQFPSASLSPTAGGFRTLILADLARMEGTDAEREGLLSRLQRLEARPEVAGELIDLGAERRVQAAMDQAANFPACPYAMNLAAGTIKEVIDGYWALNPDLEYIVLIGNDEVLPFFRHPDQALLGSEKQYVPPVRDATTSQASLRLGYVLSQDDYGARLDVSIKDDRFPVPELAVGRLVETIAEVSAVLDAYLTTSGGVVNTPASAFVSGYDFMEDTANAVAAELRAGLGGGTVDTLITPRDVPPTDPSAWTADQLRAALFGSRHDLIFLAGHFSAGSALAADYTTRLDTGDLLASNVDLTNALVYSIGCHSGYNIVNEHGVRQVTREPDWAQAFARKGATLIAGTGYQYGDTDFIRYSEALYLELTRKLREGTGPVPVGKALVEAKIAYLAGTPYLRGIDEKALLEATLFGLPMLSVNLPGSRLPEQSDPSVVSGLTPFAANPGSSLGLAYYDLSVQPQLNQVTVPLQNIQDPGTGQPTVTPATYFSGPDGVLSNPNEPVLPLALYNVSVPGQVLRGVGFRSGTYQDLAGVVPFTGAPATEIRGVHTPFLSNYFFPVQTWWVNYFEALAGGRTLLSLLPAQFKSASPTAIDGTLRSYQAQSLRLYYSNHIQSYSNGTSTPALAAAPAIVSVRSFVENDQVRFQLRVTGDPAAGIQEVWITYTGESGALAGTWQSLDLTQNAQDSTLWEGILPLNGFPAGQMRFFAQAVNGVGLVSMDSNQGSYYIPGVVAGVGASTSLQILTNPGSGRYGETVTFSARLTSDGAGLAGKALVFTLGPQSRIAVTNGAGEASVTLSIYGRAGNSEIQVAYAGDSGTQPASASQAFTVRRQITQLTLDPPAASGFPDEPGLITATLMDATGRRLGEETVFFIVRGGGLTAYEAVITDYAGRAELGPVALPPGEYTVEAYFSGQVPLPQAVSLQDDRYEPARVLNGSLTLLSRQPQAAPDAYQTPEDTQLEVPAPGVLANDSSPTGSPLTAVLISGPANGQVTLNPDGSFIYQPAQDFTGSDTFTYQATDGVESSADTLVMIEVTPVNEPPDCSGAVPSLSSLWPPNGKLVPVTILNLTDPDGDSISYTIHRVFQDERVGKAPDATIDGGTVFLRAERDGNGDGRVYHIYFTATDASGATCQESELLVGVPHDQHTPPVDGGPLYDSTQPQ